MNLFTISAANRNSMIDVQVGRQFHPIKWLLGSTSKPNENSLCEVYRERCIKRDGIIIDTIIVYKDIYSYNFIRCYIIQDITLHSHSKSLGLTFVFSFTYVHVKDIRHIHHQEKSLHFPVPPHAPASFFRPVDRITHPWVRLFFKIPCVNSSGMRRGRLVKISNLFLKVSAGKVTSFKVRLGCRRGNTINEPFFIFCQRTHRRCCSERKLLNCLNSVDSDHVWFAKFDQWLHSNYPHLSGFFSPKIDITISLNSSRIKFFPR